MVRKRGNNWCVLHAHEQKPGSKTDKPAGSVIKCYPFEPGNESSEKRAHDKALAHHQAIMANQ